MIELTTPEQELLARYFLSRLLDTTNDDKDDFSGTNVSQRRQDQESAPSIVYPQVSKQVRFVSVNVPNGCNSSISIKIYNFQLQQFELIKVCND